MTAKRCQVHKFQTGPDNNISSRKASKLDNKNVASDISCVCDGNIKLMNMAICLRVNEDIFFDYISLIKIFKAFFYSFQNGDISLRRWITGGSFSIM